MGMRKDDHRCIYSNCKCRGPSLYKYILSIKFQYVLVQFCHVNKRQNLNVLFSQIIPHPSELALTQIYYIQKCGVFLGQGL